MSTDTKVDNKITVADAIVELLEAYGVGAVYGVISIHNLPVADAIGRRDSIRFVPARGEAGSAAMADAHGRFSGLGVVLTSTGAGAGNAAGALMEALNAGTPLLHITGQVERDYLDRDAGFIHETRDQPSLLRGCSKAVYRILHPEQAVAITQRAIQEAMRLPAGPVSIEIPVDVQAALIARPNISARRTTSLAFDVTAAHALSERLRASRRPMLWVGGGAIAAVDTVRRLADLGVTVLSSTHGRGILADSHPRSLRAFHNDAGVAALLERSDLLIVAGSRLRSNETATYSLPLTPHRVQIDIDPAACNRNYAMEAFVQGDCAQVLGYLADRLEAAGPLQSEIGVDDVAKLVATAESALRKQLGPYATLSDAVRSVLPEDGIVVRDITMSGSTWGSRLLGFEHPLCNIHSLAGAIGLGLPKAIGSAVANPNRKVLALLGDGGLMLGVGELATAVQEQLDVVFLVMNDGGYGVMRGIQRKYFGDRQFYNELHTPNFHMLAEAMGMPAWRLDNVEACEEILGQAVQHAGPALVEVDMAALGPLNFAGPPQKRLY
ncbi:thiamine pyrophosphate-binding protein [Dyella sp. ASV21]|uniref:thiamine pyrophosphate-binding protein n=1 Tax=Dyella sp. ASV21 TaxID=2795114 RepID=UPI0018ED57E2|nr:thiamine pyrophosphate-binding protein [Dyella sp. ASV21]